MKKISRRSFLTATGILTASAALTACSGGGSTGKAGAAASSAPASSAAASEAADPSKYEVTEPITITWWHALESQYDDLVADVVKKFNETQSLITVEAQYIGAYKDINEALVAAHAAGTGLPAIAVANTDYVASYGDSGLFENLDPYIEGTSYDTDDFSAGLLLSSQFEGKQVALPFLHSTQVIYYNKTMADANGWTIPEKIEDFTPFLAEVHKTAGVYGTVVPGWDQWYFETLYLNEGVQIITDDNTCDLGSDTALGVTSMIKDWCDAGDAYFATGTDASAAMRQNFYDQKTFSVMHTSSLYNNYVSKCPDFEVGMAWYPAASTGDKNSEVGGCVLGIPSKNDQATKNAAWQFLQFLCGKEVNMEWAEKIAASGVKYYIEVANMPTTNDALNYLRAQKGIIVAPSKAVNAGGVGVSALEMAQNSERLVWTAEEVDHQLHKMMENIHKVSAEAAAEYGLGYDLVAGANIAGFKKVAEAMMEQGCF